MDAVDELARNSSHCVEWSNDSFSGVLHEQRIWHAREYQKFESALYELSRIHRGAHSLPRVVCWQVFEIFSFTMLCISAHYDPNDGYRVRNLSDGQLSDWRERLRLVTEGFFEGEMPDPDMLAGDVNAEPSAAPDPDIATRPERG